MKKILLISDTHSYIDSGIIKYAKQADEIWHAGDIGKIDVLLELEKIKKIKAVFGNIDGAEIRSSILELNSNYYFALSNSRTGKDNIKEEVADGYDIEIGAHVPYVPTAKFYTKYFEYDIPGGSDFEGLEYSSKIGVPNSGIDFEIGFKDYANNGSDDEWFFNLTFSLNKINADRNFITDKAFERVSMKDKKYEKVRRENIILKTEESFSIKTGGF